MRFVMNYAVRILVILVLLGIVFTVLAAEGGWTQKADMPTARRYLSTCVVDGKIYAVGGMGAKAFSSLATLEVYDPATDKWAKGEDMPTGGVTVGYRYTVSLVCCLFTKTKLPQSLESRDGSGKCQQKRQNGRF